MPSFIFPQFLNFLLILTILFSEILISLSLQNTQQPNGSNLFFYQQCNQTCGGLQIPFPFYITSCSSSSSSSSCGWSSSVPLLDSFRLSCFNKSILLLNINSQNYRVLEFFTDGILVDFPGLSSTCRPYNDLNSFGFASNNFFGISTDNVVGLYDCEDSSLCKANCEATVLPSCDGDGNGPSCCYPLSDDSIWHIGDAFSLFSKFDCRGFSCWVVLRGMSSGKRGVKLEWALPANSSEGVCAVNAHSVNASTVRHGIRCVCDDGFLGDGFAEGIGCLKSCIKNGQEAYGKDCESKRHSKRKTVILAGVLTSVSATASLIALFCWLKRYIKSGGAFRPQKAQLDSTLSFRKSCRTRLFSLTELEQATKQFSEEQKLVEVSSGSVYHGTLENGMHIAIQKIHCENERDLMRVLAQVEILSTISHRHIAQILGCCIDFGYTPMVVYEFSENGTLEEQLHQTKGGKNGLDWYNRLSIAAKTASVLAFLQNEFFPPIYHHDLKTGCIFLDQEYSVKLACFGLLNLNSTHSSHLISTSITGSNFYRSDVYDFGVMLLEIISGSKHLDMVPIALQKIRDGKIEEIVDPLLYYHDQPPLRREQIEIVADIGTRCLLFGGDGKLGMVDVARELVHVTKESIDCGSRRVPALEETFSNSSLLQMISTSPDSIHVP
ncbi:hypothetical protein Ancab_036691 [Ancistrocladus abbreviatus]